MTRTNICGDIFGRGGGGKRANGLKMRETLVDLNEENLFTGRRYKLCTQLFYRITVCFIFRAIIRDPRTSKNSSKFANPTKF